MKSLPHPRTEDLDLVDVLSACAEPTRLRLLSEISLQPGKSCGTFAVEIAKSTLSGHFKILRESGLIRQSQGPKNSRINEIRTDDLNQRFPGLLEAVLHAWSTQTPSPNRILEGPHA